MAKLEIPRLRLALMVPLVFTSVVFAEEAQHQTPVTGPARAAELISGSRAQAPADRAKRAVGAIAEIDISKRRLIIESSSGRSEWRWDKGTQIGRGDERLTEESLKPGQQVRIVVETRRKRSFTKSIEILSGP